MDVWLLGRDAEPRGGVSCRGRGEFRGVDGAKPVREFPGQIKAGPVVALAQVGDGLAEAPQLKS